MALCRCLEMHAWPEGRSVAYVAYVKPVGYPNTAAICGLCEKPGVIWLDRIELTEYQKGQRIFEGPSKFAKLLADDRGVQER